MRTGQLLAARLALGVMALALAGAAPAAARSLEGYWELQVEDVDGTGNCKIRENTVVAIFRKDGRIRGSLGTYSYPNIELDGDTLGARFRGNWDGVLGSAAVESELNAMGLEAQVRGTLSEAGDRIDARETIPCASNRGDTLASLRDYHTSATLKRVDLAITLVQEVEGVWREVGNIAFGRPFHVEIRASRALSQASYPVTLAWLEAPWVSRDGPPLKETATTVRRVGGDATLYRSGPIEVAPIADGAPGSGAGLRGEVQVLNLASGTKVFATAGRVFVPMLAASARVGWLFHVIAGAALVAGLALLGGLGFAVMKMASLAAAKLGPGRRAPSQSSAQPGEADAPSEGETETDAQPAFSATARRDRGTQRVERIEPGEAPVIRFRVRTGRPRSAIDLETTAA